MNPPPTPPEEGSQCRGTLDEFPSWEGPGVGRFMGPNTIARRQARCPFWLVSVSKV